MRLEQVQSPGILPDFVACYAATLIGGDRSMTFAAGRECAAQAITRLCGPEFSTHVGRGPQGEPLWPEGLTGSITHKDDFFWAAVARTSDALSIGIDAERIMDPQRAQRIAPAILLEQEQSVGGDAFDPALRLTLVFAIKEAVFKCLYPIVQKRFYYDALMVTSVDLRSKHFAAALMNELPGGFARGSVIEGHLMLDQRHASTAVVLRSGAQSSLPILDHVGA
jgi:enterobactin synthetase component D